MASSITTYYLKNIEAEDYHREKMSPHQIARMNTALYGTPDPDVEEHVTRSDGRTTIYYYDVQDDGSVVRKWK